MMMMQAEPSSRSGLYDSLAVYLNNKHRLQPIIGLGSITECVQRRSPDMGAVYLCEACVCRLSKADMRNHIMGSLHRYNYIQAQHPSLVCQWKENPDLSNLAWPLMDIAKQVEEKEGPGDVQTLEVEDVLYQKIATESENIAVTVVKHIKDWQGALQSHFEAISPEGQSQRIVLLTQDQQQQQQQRRIEPPQVDGTSQWTQTNGEVSPDVGSENWSGNDSGNAGPGDGATRQKPGANPSKKGERRKQKPKRAVPTLFKVSLPLSEGPVLLARTPFGEDALGPSPSPPPDSVTDDWEGLEEADVYGEDIGGRTDVTSTVYFSEDWSERTTEDGLWDYDEETPPEGLSQADVHSQDRSWPAWSSQETESSADQWQTPSSQSFNQQVDHSVRHLANPGFDADHVYLSPPSGHVTPGTNPHPNSQIGFTPCSRGPLLSPQDYMTQPVGIQGAGVIMSYPGHCAGHGINPDCYYPSCSSSSSSSSHYWAGTFMSNTDVRPVPSVCDAGHVHSRHAGLSEADEFQGWR